MRGNDNQLQQMQLADPESSHVPSLLWHDLLALPALAAFAAGVMLRGTFKIGDAVPFSWDTLVEIPPRIGRAPGETEWIEVGWGDPAGWGSVNGVVPVHSGAELTNIAHELGVAMYQATVPDTVNDSFERFNLERANGALPSGEPKPWTETSKLLPSGSVPRVSA